MIDAERTLWCMKCGRLIVVKDETRLLPEHKGDTRKKCPGSHELGLAPVQVSAEESQEFSLQPFVSR